MCRRLLRLELSSFWGGGGCWNRALTHVWVFAQWSSRAGPGFYTPSQTVVERNAPYRTEPINRHTPGRAVIERSETATIHPNLPWEPWQNVAKRGRTWQNLKGPWDAGEYTCFPSHYGPLRSFVTASYVQSHFVVFTPFYYGLLGFSSAPWLPWQFFWQFKNLARRPRQSRDAHPVPMGCLPSIPFCPWWPETWLPWPPGT